jgi:hypothetical protein
LLFADGKADVGFSTFAMKALPAFWRKESYNMISNLKIFDSLPQLHDDSSTLMPQNTRSVATWIRTAGRVKVGMANPACLEFHKDFAPLGRTEIHFLNPERFTKIF